MSFLHQDVTVTGCFTQLFRYGALKSGRDWPHQALCEELHEFVLYTDTSTGQAACREVSLPLMSRSALTGAIEADGES